MTLSGDSFTTRDLVQLYKNIDLENQMIISNIHQCKRNVTNQYIEDVVYHDDADSDSNLSEIYSTCEDLDNIPIINKGQADLLHNEHSLKSLCHKLSDLEIQVSNISTDYGPHFLLKDPYVKEHATIPQWMDKANTLDKSIVLLPSLLDFICCKRLEDSFYMNNIISYVEHTIDKLRRISDGDYLPDRMKEIWKNADLEKIRCDRSKVLCSSLSTAFQMKNKVVGVSPTWVDVVYSEVDFKSLVKMLNKSIFFNIPKIILSSYDSFQKTPTDRIIVSSKSKKQLESRSQNRRWLRRNIEQPDDIIIQIQCSKTDQFLSEIGSVVISQLKEQITPKDCTETLTLTCDKEEMTSKVIEVNEMNTKSSTFDDTETTSTHDEEKIIPKVIELHELDTNFDKKSSSLSLELCSLNSQTDDEEKDDDDYESKDCDASIELNRPGSPSAVAQILVGSVSRLVRTETATNHATPNDFPYERFSILDLDHQSSLPEDSLLDSVYTNVRNKSPLKVKFKSPYENNSVILEEKKRRRLLEIRERRERRKRAMSDKMIKHKPAPHAVNSVTKLSITNKSFYNSIYGCNINNNKRESTSGTLKKDAVIEEQVNESEEDSIQKENILSSRTSTMIQRHFLDEVETEMSYAQKRQNNFLSISTATFVSSHKSTTNLGTKSNENICIKDQKSVRQKLWLEQEEEMPEIRCTLHRVPSNSPTGSTRSSPVLECRRSIEKIFTLMKKLSDIESNEGISNKTDSLHMETKDLLLNESITNTDRNLSFTNPVFKDLDENLRNINDKGDITNRSIAVVPKVVFGTKPQSMETYEIRKKRKKSSDVRAPTENPLKAISQLLHEFDNIKNSKQRHADPKLINRSIATEPRNVSPVPQKRQSKSPVKTDLLVRTTAKVKTRFTTREEIKQDVTKTQGQDRTKMCDLTDEAREARGEAVRGPPKFRSRLNMLAQPKRSYVQALNEDMARRQILERNRAKFQHRRGGDKPPLNVTVKQQRSDEPAAGLPRSTSGGPESRYAKSSQFVSFASTTATSLQPSLKKHCMEVKSNAHYRSSHSMERIKPPRAPLPPKDLISSSRTSSIPKKDIPQSCKPHNIFPSVLSAKRVRGLTEPASFMTKSCIDELTPPSSIEDDDDFIHSNEIVVKTVVEETLIEKSCESNSAAALNSDTQVNSIIELKMLEHALYRKLSCGAFSSRLRLNKLTLTPKSSLQCIVNHKTGDTSLAIEPDLLKKQAFSNPHEQKIDLIALLSTSQLNCDLYGFPLRIPKVAFGPSDSGTSYVVYEKRTPVTRVLEIKNAMNNKTCQSVMTDAKSIDVGVAAQVSCYYDSVVDSATTTVTDRGDALRRNVETNTTEVPIVTLFSDRTTEHDPENLTSTTEMTHELSEYTTSLDMLVGLLNEIQRITTLPSDVSETETKECQQNERENPDMSIHEKSVVSITEVSEINADDCFSILTSNNNANNDAQIEAIVTENLSLQDTQIIPIWIEKKISCHLPEMQQLHVEVGTDTDFGSSILSEQAEQTVVLLKNNNDDSKSHLATTTMKSGSAVETMVNVPTSKCSVSSVTHSGGSNPSEIIIDGLVEIERSHCTVKSLVPFYDNMSKIHYKTKDRPVISTQVTLSQRNVLTVYDNLTNSVPVCQNRKNTNEYNKINKCLIVPDLDTKLKFKRRILVTFYSLLVLTVFVALEVPETCLNL